MNAASRSVHANKLFFLVQGPDPLLSHSSIKTMDLNAGLIINITSLEHFINLRQYYKIF